MTFHTDASPQAAASFWFVARTVDTDTTRENEAASNGQNSHDDRRTRTHQMNSSTDGGHGSRLLLLQAVAHHAYPVSPIDDLGG